MSEPTNTSGYVDLIKSTDKLTAQVAHLNENVKLNENAIELQTSNLEKLKKVFKYVITVGVVLAGVVAFVVVLYVKTNSISSCTKAWADKYTSRADILTTLSTKRAEALDTFVRQLGTAPGGTIDQATFNKDLKDYLAASDAYKTAVKENPIPRTPQFDC